MWPFKKRNWIDERLKEAESIFQGVDIDLPNYGRLTNSSEAIAAFVALSIKVKEAAHNNQPIGFSMSDLATFLQFKHSLMPDGKWKQRVELAVNRFRETRDMEAEGLSDKKVMRRLDKDIKNLLSVLDDAMAELSK
jgi:hypothetical protein